MKFLESLGDFIGPVVRCVPITLDGKTRDFHFREIGGGDAEDMLSLIQAEDFSIPVERQKEFGRRVMAASICDAEGRPQMAWDEVGLLPKPLYRELRRQAFLANGLTADPSDAEDEESSEASEPAQDPPSPKG